MKKWQLLLIAMIISIMILMILSVFSEINVGISGRYVFPESNFWSDSCENITEWNNPDNITMVVNTTDYREMFGSMHFNYTLSGSTFTIASLSNYSMAQYSIYRAPPNEFFNDTVVLETCYGAFGRNIDLSGYHNSTGLYFIYWLASGGRYFSFHAQSGFWWTILSESHGYRSYNTTVPMDHEWHWFEVRLIFDNITGIDETFFGYYIDGVAVNWEIGATPNPLDWFLPITFMTGGGGYDNHRDWQIDYLRVNAAEEYPPTLPYFEPDVVNPIDYDIVMLAIGLIGAMLVVVTPVYAIETFIEGNYIEALGYGFLGMILGAAFIIAWLAL